MKRSINIIFTIGIIMFSFKTSIAQQQGRLLDTARHIKAISKDLGVSSERAKGIVEVLTLNRDSIISLVSNAKISADKRQERIRALLDERRMRINAFLTPAEYQKFIKHQKDTFDKKKSDQEGKRLEELKHPVKGGVFKGQVVKS